MDSASEAALASADIMPAPALEMKEGMPDLSGLNMKSGGSGAMEVETMIPLFANLLLFAASGLALGLTMMFIIRSFDVAEDLLNPYDYVARVNPKLNIEFAAHGAAAFLLLFCSSYIPVTLAVPTLALRALWWKQNKLVVDATTCFVDRAQSSLRIRWGIMAAWHGVCLLLAFIQLLMHLIMALSSHDGFRNAMEEHGKRMAHTHGMAHGMYHPMMHMHGM